MQTKLHNIDLLIFDLDGTLINSLPDLTDSVNFALISMEKNSLTEQEIQKHIGSGLRYLLEQVSGFKDDFLLGEMQKYFIEYYDNNYYNRSYFYNGVYDLLTHYTNKKKVVLSNKLHHYTLEIIKKAKLYHFFDYVMGEQPELYAPKPSPEGINIILEKLNIPAKNTIMIGDSTHDIEAGKNAGVFTCAVTYGFRSKEVLSEAGPDIIIDDMGELVKYVY